MDFNRMFEEEVRIRCEAYKKELDRQYEEYKKEYAKQAKANLIKILTEIQDKISDYSFDTVMNRVFESDTQNIADECFYKNKKNSTIRIPDENLKCDFPSCKNYGDGTLDNICSQCGSHLTKVKKDNACRENLKNSAAYKNSSFKENINTMVNNQNAEKRENDFSNKKNNAKSINSLYDTLEPLLKIYGITREDFNNSKIFVNDPKVVKTINDTLNDLLYF